ncbi:hypothetical protein GGF37_003097 [Kickxella alabastrina]|nr:hypothetical protein GGF37_003097 [Kickxella alabastrina]
MYLAIARKQYILGAVRKCERQQGTTAVAQPAEVVDTNNEVNELENRVLELEDNVSELDKKIAECTATIEEMKARLAMEKRTRVNVKRARDTEQKRYAVNPEKYEEAKEKLAAQANQGVPKGPADVNRREEKRVAAEGAAEQCVIPRWRARSAFAHTPTRK